MNKLLRLFRQNNNTVIAGIGNYMRGDDGVGLYISDKLIEKGIKRVFNCGTVPENYINKICELNPEVVVFIDAVDFKKSPGSIEILNISDSFAGLTTHNVGLNILAEFIENNCNAKVLLLGIQPEGLSGCNLSKIVKIAADKIINTFG